MGEDKDKNNKKNKRKPGSRKRRAVERDDDEEKPSTSSAAANLLAERIAANERRIREQMSRMIRDIDDAKERYQFNEDSNNIRNIFQRLTNAAQTGSTQDAGDHSSVNTRPAQMVPVIQDPCRGMPGHGYGDMATDLPTRSRLAADMRRRRDVLFRETYQEEYGVGPSHVASDTNLALSGHRRLHKRKRHHRNTAEEEEDIDLNYDGIGAIEHFPKRSKSDCRM